MYQKCFSRFFNLFLCFLLLFVFSVAMSVDDAFATPKRKLKGNMEEVYNKLPEEATNWKEIFTKGMFYGRFRINSFKWDYAEHHQSGKTNRNYDPWGFAVGGSLILKSAPFYGVSATLGYYYSNSLGVLNNRDAVYGKSGKDTFSRHDAVDDDNWYMSVLAQAYIEFDYMKTFLKTDVKAGRMIYNDSPFIKSNDTKMIPNTMQGFAFKNKLIPQTTLHFAWFDKQKLRDHTRFHDVITFGSPDTSKVKTVHGKTAKYYQWEQNDDSAVHKGLTPQNLRANHKKIHNSLLIAGMTNKSIKNLKLDFWFNSVPGLFHTILTEANYKIDLGGGWSVTPGFRYMHQFDVGAGKVGGAGLTGKLAGHKGYYKGYHDADDADATLFGVRLVFKKGAGKLHFGYTKVTDDGDFISPWRGWPTKGYTRSMAQYNWEANTKSFMIKGVYDFDKAKIISGLKVALDYAYMDYDKTKERLGGINKTDRDIIHMDVIYGFPHLKKLLPSYMEGLEGKFRVAFVDAERRHNPSANRYDPSYNEFRWELNYLF